MGVNVRHVAGHLRPVKEMFALAYGRGVSDNAHCSVVPRINRLSDLIVPASRHWRIERICEQASSRTSWHIHGPYDFTDFHAVSCTNGQSR